METQFEYLSVKHHHEGDLCFLSCSGSLTRTDVADFDHLICGERKRFKNISISLENVHRIDSAGVALLLSHCKNNDSNSAVVTLKNISEPVKKTFQLFQSPALIPSAEGDKMGYFERKGDKLINSAGEFLNFMQLAADSTIGLVRGFFHKGIIVWSDVAVQASYIGAQALPIVALIALLIGLTLAFQSAYQLKAFGIDVFVASLTGIAMVREMGPLMTAILVAGRSGSSIAAEIATMKVSEEIDALQVMGIEPRHFLAVPRLLALMLMLPVLTVYAIAIGIGGGFIVGVYYVGLAPIAYLNQTLDSLVLNDLLSGLLKSFVFAWGIAMIGIYYGFQVRGGAQDVGRATTDSVVAGIFYIIVADCIFSIIFYVIL